MNLPILATDALGIYLPDGLMNFVVPGAITAGILVFIGYKLAVEWGLFEDFLFS